MREGQGCGTPEEPSPNSSEIEEGFLEEVAYEPKAWRMNRILPGEVAGEGHSK